MACINVTFDPETDFHTRANKFVRYFPVDAYVQ